MKETRVWYPNERIKDGIDNGEVSDLNEAQKYWDMYLLKFLLFRMIYFFQDFHEVKLFGQYNLLYFSLLH